MTEYFLAKELHHQGQRAASRSSWQKNFKLSSWQKNFKLCFLAKEPLLGPKSPCASLTKWIDT